MRKKEIFHTNAYGNDYYPFAKTLFNLAIFTVFVLYSISSFLYKTRQAEITSCRP